MLGAAQTAAVIYVWPLWHGRADPPNLATVDLLAGWPFGVPLVVSAWAFVRWPRAGSVAHALVLLVAVLGDELRALPEFLSLAVLMVALAWGELGRVIGQAHLASLWLWSGVNKALSPNWPTGSAAFIAQRDHLPSMRPVLAVAVPAAEIALGLAACVPRWRVRWPVRAGAAALHGGILLALVVAHFNLVVWPWNLALAIVAPALLGRRAPAPGAEPSAPATASALAPAPARTTRRVAIGVWVFALVFPAGFYLGVTDTYLAHNLYSDNTAAMQWCGVAGCPAKALARAGEAYNSPYPPEPRIFVAWFAARCEPGDTLRVVVPELRVPRRGAGTTTYACPRS